MVTLGRPWDYLILTASNDRQAAGYEAQLDLRRRLGMLPGARCVLVVPDPQGRRIGSGGSTVHCLLEVLNRELGSGGSTPPAEPESWLEVLREKRILIVHAGGDSKRLPAYGPCGKAFIPIPGPNDRSIPRTLLDRQLPTYLALPEMPPGAGQVVVVAGDDLKLFEPQAVRWAPEGVTALGCYATPELVSRHGGFCLGEGGRVRRYFQKASPQRQRELGAIDRYGRVVLDIAVVSFDARAAVAMLQVAAAGLAANGRLAWTGAMAGGILGHGLDLFSDVCCAMGSEATCDDYARDIRALGGAWSDEQLRAMYGQLSPLPLSAQVLRACSFLHFGTTVQLISSGQEIFRRDGGIGQFGQVLEVDNDMAPGGALVGSHAWVEGCRIAAELRLEGENVVTGVDVDEPTVLRRGMCLDVLAGTTRDGRDAWFVRCYGCGDAFKDSVADGATLCHVPVLEWLEAAGASAGDVWPRDLPPERQTVWDARLFPATDAPNAWKQWTWMFSPAAAADDAKRKWLAADRYSLAEIALWADLEAFCARRERLAAADCARRVTALFRPDSAFSAHDLAQVLRRAGAPAAVVARLLGQAGLCGPAGGGNVADFTHSRVLHSLGSAVLELADAPDEPLAKVVPGLSGALAAAGLAAEDAGFPLPAEDVPAGAWAEALQAAAVRLVGDAILSHGEPNDRCPVSVLRKDEIVWGRAPVRLELGGGWTDTPPYTLEFGGAVLNAAVDLNGQPPIQTYLRVIDEPVIRVASIDVATRIEIARLAELLDYRRPGNEFALVKAALALSGFSPETAAWPQGVTLREMLETFGGGVEITTLAGVPKGSGLGTSSIIGAVILAVIHRALGRQLTQRELFHKVLQLEQALTTGGGWQDQIGGMVDGVKITKTRPGAVPDPSVHMVPGDVLDPRCNGGSTILYYTGLTRLAKDILQQIVGRYLDRDGEAMEALAQEYALAHEMAEAMARRDARRFGELIDVAWGLQQKLCPFVTNPQIESLLARVRRHVHGARILGAGSGGFLLMVCKSPQDAAAVRQDLRRDPPNDQARFFDFSLSREGLVVTAC